MIPNQLPAQPENVLIPIRTNAESFYTIVKIAELRNLTFSASIYQSCNAISQSEHDTLRAGSFRDRLANHPLHFWHG